MLKPASGVSTSIVPRKPSQASRFSARRSAKSRAQCLETSALASSGEPASPITKMSEASPPGATSMSRASAAQGSRPASTVPDSEAPARDRGRPFGAALADEFGAVRGHRLRGAVACQEGDPVGEFETVGVARQQRAGRPVERGQDGGRVSCAVGAEHPFGIGIDPEPHRNRAAVADRQARQLDRILLVDELRQLGDELAAGHAEDAVALAVPRLVSGRRVADHGGEWREAAARRLVVDVDRFARPIGDRIVRPRRQLVVAAVAAPGEGRAFGRTVEAERRVRDDVDPGLRRGAVAGEPDDVFAPLLGKAAIAVPVGQVRSVRLGVRDELHARRRPRRLPLGLQPPVAGSRGCSSAASARSIWSNTEPLRVCSTMRAADSRVRYVRSSIRSRRTAKICWRGPCSLPRRRLFSQSRSIACCRSCT